MATVPFAGGSLRGKAVNFGPNDNNDVTIDSTSGQVEFAIGTPTATVAEVFPSLRAPSYTTSPSTSINASTKIQDSVQILNQWIGSYLLDTPPPVQNIAATKDASKISVTWTLPPQKRLAFTASTAPYIQYVKADVIPHANNLDGLWTNTFSTLTLETPSTNAFATATTLQLYVQSGTSSLLSGVYSAAGAVVSQTAYDIRVYLTNQSNQTPKYATIFNYATDGVGTPDAPTALALSSVTQSTAQSSWTAPVDRDITATGTQLTPFIAQYRLDRVTTSSTRYGGALADTTSLTTTATTSTDSTTTLSVTAMHPGTAYNFQVFAKNTINPSYGPGSNIYGITTSYPSATSYLSISDCTAINPGQLTTLIAPYLANGGYSLSGTAAPVILNAANMTNTNLYLSYSGLRRTNYTPGDTSSNIGSLSAYGGPSSTYTSAANQATLTTAGFGTTTADGSVTSSSGAVSVKYLGDGDQYTSPTENTGFYKVINATAVASNVSTSFTPGSAPYSLQLKYLPVGGSLLSTPQVQFYVDALNAASTVSNAAIIAEVGSNSTQISGVATFTTSATFKTQFNQNNIACYFLRNDRKHDDVTITTASGTTVSSVLSIYDTSMGASHKYYTVPATAYNTSSGLVNTTGLQLVATSSAQNVQFNDFSVALTATNGIYTEALQLRVVPYSLFTNGGIPVSGGYVDPSTGASLNARLDAPSILLRSRINTSSSNYGQHVFSGTGADPSTSSFTAYDHTVSLLTVSDLQMLNGQFTTPAADANAYKLYSNVFTGTANYALYDYSSIVSDSNYRYVTFKYTGAVTNGQSKIKLTITHTGLTLGANLSSANHTLTMAVTDSGSSLSCNNMDCNAPIAANGLGTVYPVPSGTPCGDISSTSSIRNVYIPAGMSTSAVVYIRVGIANNVAAAVSTVSLSAVTVF
jgi:hypothetical protein